MKTVSAYAKLLRVPGIGTLGIVPVIAALTVGIYDLYNLTIVFIIGITPAFLLILIPILWYAAFTPLLGEKLLKPRM